MEYWNGKINMKNKTWCKHIKFELYDFMFNIHYPTVSHNKQRSIIVPSTWKYCPICRIPRPTKLTGIAMTRKAYINEYQ